MTTIKSLKCPYFDKFYFLVFRFKFICLFIAVLPGSLLANATEWKLVPSDSTQQNSIKQKSNFEPASTDLPQTQPTVWSVVPLNKSIEEPTVLDRGLNSLANTNSIKNITYGGFRDLYRGGRWLPSISTTVPMGYGAKGVMAGFGFSGSDCTIESKQCINHPTPTITSIQEIGEAVLDSYIGFGDPLNGVSVLISNITQNTIRQGQSGKYLGGNQTGVSISRNIGPDTAIKIGTEGMIRWGGPRNLDSDRPKSAFGVISHRITLRPEPTDPFDTSTRWFSDLYLTVGVGNGQYRPLDQVISAQIQYAKDAGCWDGRRKCNDMQWRDAFLKGTEWGNYYPLGVLTLAVTDQAHLITEWWGRNLNVSLSLQPFKEIGWTITPGVGNLIPNSDYGNNVNIPACRQCDMGEAITTRPLFYLRSMLNIKF
ncbi:hypothetical protein [Synechococcus sp. UW140]|uniref:hypothetical protein n=1 Tax=Synechococcus sp. UW140 TaxID=368503 RepID=UPI00313790D0